MPNQIPETDLLAPFLQTEAPAPEEPEAEEPEYVCECCSEGMDADEAHTVAVGERGYHNSAGFYATMVNTEIWCDSCFRDSTVYINDYRDYRNLRECGSRGYVSEGYASDNFYCHDSGEWYCAPQPDYDEDEDEDSGSERMLLGYSTDVIDVLGWPRESRASDLLFGVELEMEGKGATTADDIVRILGGAKGTRTGRAILKSDGSLEDGRGAELVTLPYPLTVHQSAGFWQDLLDSRLQAAAKSGVGTDHCGIHVHISRAPLSALTVGKMVVFLNNPDNSAFVTTIAQRRSGSYCKRDEKKKHGAVLAGDYANSRYDIINITGHATVEVRMFKGNLRPERVLKNVEFCHALVRFCESHGITEAQRWGSFMLWLEKQRKAYPNLCGFLAEKDYMRPSRNATIAVPADA